ncbi:hypothetical protein GCM10012275_54850 [Longimycelium tulufanense]|uniref:Uncharacterized protein n=1 Tax=Longimycelium tulufanense TaxID=907463 RepID=A0A8J3CJL0_9PSEU|nr:hypothetical protein [Longimycelium tulufanense]GGM77251.1 hypothetical protein GCM10012275_54850 [Longimycelium tulufanense]
MSSQHTDLVRVDEGQFRVEDRPPTLGGMGDYVNGLAQPMLAGGAWIHAGINCGPVRATVQPLDYPPAELDPGPWDDVVEISVVSLVGRMRVQPLYADDVTPDLPLVSSMGPGCYRLRVHARGRDDHYDQVVEEPTEDYLILSWPAPMMPELVIAGSSTLGQQLRMRCFTDTYPLRSAPRAEDGMVSQQEWARKVAHEDNLERARQQARRRT